MSDSTHSVLAHHFDDLDQQKEAATLGTWAFLATEVMFFGGAFVAFAVYRHRYWEGFITASQFENWIIGAINTGVLLCSSLTMALAVWAAHKGNSKQIIGFLLATIFLACVFIGIKGYEYTHIIQENHAPWQADFAIKEPPPGSAMHGVYDQARHENGARIYFSFYFGMTGIHAAHMVIGIGLMIWLIIRAYQGRFSAQYSNPVEMTGLYWHFVDIVWIFLYPVFYLIDPIWPR